jgi:putative hydrolase of the HAD superfamily
MRKPDAESFQLILNENSLQPEETLFLDDTEMHLIGAQQLNIQTKQVSKQNDIHAIFKNI